MDVLFMARMLQDRYGEKKWTLHMYFEYLEKVFDQVPRKMTEWALRKKGVNERLARVVLQLNEGQAQGVG